MGKLIYTRLCWWFTLRIKPVYWNMRDNNFTIRVYHCERTQNLPIWDWQMLIPPSQKIMGCGHVMDSQIMDFVHIWGSITRITPYTVDDIWFWSIYISSINVVFLELMGNDWNASMDWFSPEKKIIKFTGNPNIMIFMGKSENPNLVSGRRIFRINPWNQFTRQLLVMISIWVNNIWTNNCQVNDWVNYDIWVNIIYQNYIYMCMSG